MNNKDKDCAGCSITDQISAGYVSWKVASTIVGLLLIGIFASYSYTDRSLARAEEKIQIINTAQDAADTDLKDTLSRIEIKLDNTHDAVIAMQGMNKRTLHTIAGTLSALDRQLTTPRPTHRYRPPQSDNEINLMESPRVTSQADLP